MAHNGDYQLDIYRAGLRGVVPTLPVDFPILAEADLLMAVNGYPTIQDVRATGATRR